MGPVLIVLGGVAFVALVYVIATFNGLVRVRNHCVEAWSNIDTELKRRYDLIPNLVSTVKGYAAHEKDLLGEITRLRQICVENNGTPEQQAATENELVRGINTLLARVENYPDLKAGQNFLELQQELTNTEDRIQAARRFYNGNVRELNNKIETFPSMVIANMGGFQPKEFFTLDDLSIRRSPKAEFQHSP